MYERAMEILFKIPVTVTFSIFTLDVAMAPDITDRLLILAAKRPNITELIIFFTVKL